MRRVLVAATLLTPLAAGVAVAQGAGGGGGAVVERVVVPAAGLALARDPALGLAPVRGPALVPARWGNR